MAEITRTLYDSQTYIEDVKSNLGRLDFGVLSGKTVMIFGGTGMIGSYLTDLLLAADKEITVCIVGRSAKKAKARFSAYAKSPFLRVIEHDLNVPIDLASKPWSEVHPDYLIHAASNTHPVAYAKDPIGTITANVIGTNHLLDYFAKAGGTRFVFLSSVEIYGENRGDTEGFDESYLGYIDCNTLRAGYPESKRTGEALCQAYISQKGLDIVIPRLSRTYGPTMLLSDTKALSQFILRAVDSEDIILKSKGDQLYSYGYVADQAIAILHMMLHGNCGDAINVASEGSDITLAELAHFLAETAGTSVRFELPDATEAKGYSTATKAILDLTRLTDSGFIAAYDMKTGLARTVTILRELLGK